MSIVDSTKGFFANMFDPYVRVAKGFVSAEENLKNIQEFNTPERLLELQNKKRERIDKMLANEYGPATFNSAEFIKGAMEEQGITDPYQVNVGSEYDRTMDRIDAVSQEAFAEQLTSDSRSEVLGKSAIMGVADATAFIVSMLDGPVGLLQY